MRLLSVVVTTAALSILPGEVLPGPGHFQRSWPESGAASRSNIRVKLCVANFNNVFGSDPGYSSSRLITSLKDAIAIYNDYTQSDLRYTYDGTTSGAGCAQTDTADNVADGMIYFSAFAVGGTDLRATIDTRPDPYNADSLFAVQVRFYRTNIYGVASPINLDPRGGELQTMVHEMGHVLLAGGDVQNCVPESVVCYGACGRHIWDNDIVQMKTSCPPGSCTALPYEQNPGYQIVHRVSTDGGISWSQQNDNLGERTNLAVGVDYGVTSNPNYPYVIAWVAADGTNAIHTAIGNGTTWTSKTSFIWPSETGVSVAYGGGKWVLAWSNPDNDIEPDRQVFWMTSTNGTSWSLPHALDVTYSHGALTGPTVRYDANSGRFIIGFVQWENESPLAEQLRVVFCSSSNPDVSFTGCTLYEHGIDDIWNLLPYGINSPAIACRGQGYQNCSVTIAEAVGPQDNQLMATCGHPTTSSFIFTSDLWFMGSSYSSRSEISATFGNDRYLIAFRGQDGSTRGNTAIKYSACGAWSSKLVWPVSFQFGPTVVYGGGKFTVYYGQ